MCYECTVDQSIMGNFIPKSEPVVDGALAGNLTLEGAASLIKSGKCKQVCFMTGAGISTSAGIPDFRSPNLGLYFTMATKFKLSNPMNLFMIDYYVKHPEPFLYLAKEMVKLDVKPTVSHYFQYLLERKGILLRSFTQNVDALELLAGMHADLVVEAHGSARGAHCLNSKCRKPFSRDWFVDKVLKDERPNCDECGNLVKPDIVFFGEMLPGRFFETARRDLPRCDLLIIMGTSLVVQPFASMVDQVPDSCPRLLINREPATGGGWWASIFGGGGGLRFDAAANSRDIFWKGDCDVGCQLLADSIGWGDELRRMVKEGNERLERTGGKIGGEIEEGDDQAANDDKTLEVGAPS